MQEMPVQRSSPPGLREIIPAGSVDYAVKIMKKKKKNYLVKLFP